MTRAGLGWARDDTPFGGFLAKNVDTPCQRVCPNTHSSSAISNRNFVIVGLYADEKKKEKTWSRIEFIFKI